MMFKARYLLSAALAPAVLLFFYIRKKDKVEPEPMKLLLLMALGGALTTIPAAILELIGGAVLGIVFTEGSPVFNFIESFFIVALAEEGCKYIVLLLTSWWSKEFNYTYDAVVYAVSVSLGFAALENVLYVFQGGFSTAILRALTSVPGHMIFAVFMGYHYGIAKKAFCSKKVGLTITAFVISLVLPMLIHGFYDFCLFMQSWFFTLIFLGFYVVVTVLGFLVVNKLSREDSPINAPSEPPMYTGMYR